MTEIVLKKAFDVARTGKGDPAIITYALPKLFEAKAVDEAYKLSKQYKADSQAWLPEMLTLLGVQGLTTPAKRRMLNRIFGDDAPDLRKSEDVAALADCCARLGRIGFSFPQWRFVTQGFNNASLIERFGYTKLERATDVQNEILPKSDPARDKYGIGFVRHEGEWSVEYRRAYILCSRQSDENPATIVIRNNSHFFGRDRLPDPVYVSQTRFTPEELQNLNRLDWKNGRFVPLQNFFAGDRDPAVKIGLLQDVIGHFEKVDMDLSEWLACGEGRGDVMAFAAQSLARRPEGQDKPPFYLARIQPQSPPWFPRHVVPVTPDTVEGMKRMTEGGDVPPEFRQVFSSGRLTGGKTVLLSGPSGDLPLKPGFSLT